MVQKVFRHLEPLGRDWRACQTDGQQIPCSDLLRGQKLLQKKNWNKST